MDVFNIEKYKKYETINFYNINLETNKTIKKAFINDCVVLLQNCSLKSNNILIQLMNKFSPFKFTNNIASYARVLSFFYNYLTRKGLFVESAITNTTQYFSKLINNLYKNNIFKNFFYAMNFNISNILLCYLLNNEKAMQYYFIHFDRIITPDSFKSDIEYICNPNIIKLYFKLNNYTEICALTNQFEHKMATYLSKFVSKYVKIVNDDVSDNKQLYLIWNGTRWVESQNMNTLLKNVCPKIISNIIKILKEEAYDDCYTDTQRKIINNLRRTITKNQFSKDTFTGKRTLICQIDNLYCEYNNDSVIIKYIDSLNKYQDIFEVLLCCDNNRKYQYYSTLIKDADMQPIKIHPLKETYNCGNIISTIYNSNKPDYVSEAFTQLIDAITNKEPQLKTLLFILLQDTITAKQVKKLIYLYSKHKSCGKSALFSLIKHTIGSKALQKRGSYLFKNSEKSDSHNAKDIPLYKASVILFNDIEPFADQDKPINEITIKDLSGNATCNASDKYDISRTYRKICSLWGNGNKLIAIDSANKATVTRIKGWEIFSKFLINPKLTLEFKLFTNQQSQWTLQERQTFLWYILQYSHIRSILDDLIFEDYWPNIPCMRSGEQLTTIFVSKKDQKKQRMKHCKLIRATKEHLNYIIVCINYHYKLNINYNMLYLNMQEINESINNIFSNEELSKEYKKTTNYIYKNNNYISWRSLFEQLQNHFAAILKWDITDLKEEILNYLLVINKNWKYVPNVRRAIYFLKEDFDTDNNYLN